MSSGTPESILEWLGSSPTINNQSNQSNQSNPPTAEPSIVLKDNDLMLRYFGINWLWGTFNLSDMEAKYKQYATKRRNNFEFELVACKFESKGFMNCFFLSSIMIMLSLIFWLTVWHSQQANRYQRWFLIWNCRDRSLWTASVASSRFGNLSIWPVSVYYFRASPAYGPHWHQIRSQRL